MKLFRISQDVNNGYDTYDSAVVAAVDSSEAQMISPSEHYVWHDGDWYFQYADGTEKPHERLDCWTVPASVSVEYLGEARDDMKPGVIVASFNAG